MSGTLVILSGPSGVGKDTVINAWHKCDPRVERVVAYTTRPPRANEVEGVDYHFIDKAEFERLANQGHFLEYKQVHDNYYATPLRDMEELLAGGRIAVLKIDVQGALSAMEQRPDALSVFLLPPTEEELERRIRTRNLDNPSVIQKRLANAHQEIALSDRYRYRIVNDDVEQVVSELQKIISSSSCGG